MKLAVIGATGRMGRMVAGLCRQAEDIELVGGIADLQRTKEESRDAGYPRVVAPEGAAELIVEADVVLDFSSPEGLAEVLDLADEALGGRGLVVGTTGLGRAQERRLGEIAKATAVLAAANFSVGVNLLLETVERLARVLGPDAYDVEIVEAHHRDKADAPSGTALALARAVAEGRGASLEEVRKDGRSGRTGRRPHGEIGLHALRGGAVAGEHRVHFMGERERIELGHHAEGRELFAEGALIACRWIQGKGAGRYGMKDVLGL